MLGLFPDFVPKHARKYAELGSDMTRAFERYAEDVKNRCLSLGGREFYDE